MKRGMTAAVALASVLGLGTPALADCEAELERLTGQGGAEAGIAKDGSMAPLDTDAVETGDGSGAEAVGADGEGIAKDGSETPLETDVSNIATSGQDAAAQQGAGGLSKKQSDALARAETALAAGDEEACMGALEEFRAG
ncbi:hypothetical protein [Amaricoccus tamworthensis]|uniref:hypothetical protein n=1 Tax=Amaricoccus tamworthensis TaxID=57002 RepID=UPI003C7D57F5